jgi:hypothetical protein
MVPYSENHNSLLEAIIRTIAFFDLFDWPLTAWEIQANLDEVPALIDILAILDETTGSLVPAGSQKIIEQRNGFYFLAGRADIIASRQRRFNYFVRKQKIARRFARLFGLFPTVRTVYLVNLIGAYNLRDESDIDFLIVTAPGRLWLSRLYCAGLAKILNRRPRPEYKRDTLCLSFFIAADYAAWDSLKLAGGDPYFDYWRKNLVLLYNKDKTVSDRPAVSRLDRLARNFQLRIMPSVLRDAMNNSDGVIVNDSVLKFYRRDQRRAFAEKYEEKIKEISGLAR